MPFAPSTPRRASPLIALLATMLLIPVSATGDSTHQIASRTLNPGGAKKVFVDFPVGRLKIVATDDPDIHFELELRCEKGRDCDDIADDIHATVETRGDQVRIRIDDPKWHKDRHLRSRIEVPRSLAVEVDMNVGELEIEGIEEDLEISMSVGEVDVEVPESALRSVDVRVSIGDASMRPRSGSSAVRGWLGKRIDWNRGTGTSRLDIDLSVGEANVRLL